MRGNVRKQVLLALSVVMLTVATTVSASEVVSTTARGLPAVANIGGIALVPVGTQPAAYGDLAPMQLFEITKPANQSITIGRMFTSCTCVRLEADQRTFGPGERAVLRMRNVQPTPPGGQSYALYVQLASPSNATLRYDTYVQSQQFVPAPDGAPPTRGNIVADGVYAPSIDPAVGGGGTIDVIVPKADHYVSDTSDYTLRKKAEEELEKTAAAKKDTAEGGVQPHDTAADTAAKNTAPEKTEALASAQPKAAPAEKPAVPPQLRSAIDAAITQAEKDVARNARETADASVGGVSERARAEARVAAGLSTNQSEKYQSEARKIGQDILNPSAPRPALTAAASGRTGAATRLGDAEAFANRSAGSAGQSAGADDLWRKPAPRGSVRVNVPRSAEETAASAVDSIKNTEQKAVETAASGGNTVADAVRGVGRSIEDAETAVADRAREAARQVGRSVETAKSVASANVPQVQKSVEAAAQSAAGAVESAGQAASGLLRAGSNQ